MSTVFGGADVSTGNRLRETMLSLYDEWRRDLNPRGGFLCLGEVLYREWLEYHSLVRVCSYLSVSCMGVIQLQYASFWVLMCFV